MNNLNSNTKSAPIITWEKTVAKLLKKDKLEHYKRKAEGGNELAQMILGDIYFFGINADDSYRRELDTTIALARYSRKKNVSNFAFTCSCNQKPDYSEALKWYKMAALSGNADAESRIRLIQNKEQIKADNSVIQIFSYNGECTTLKTIY